MVSAIERTCEELTGSGNDATAASRAFFMMLMVSGGKDAFGKSFISINPTRVLEGDIAALRALKSFRQVDENRRQLIWIGRQSGAQPFADLRADSIAIDAIDLNTVWILAGHGRPFVAIQVNCRTNAQNTKWFNRRTILVADGYMRGMIGHT